MQRECQLGCDGSKLPKAHNYGGITDPDGKRGTCGRLFYIDRYWASFCTAQQGVEGVFKVLNQRNYRSQKTLGGIMELYSPPYENDWSQMFSIFATVGDQLDVRLARDTKVYFPGERAKYRLRHPFGNPYELPIHV